jgi:hypothetical protein
MWWWNMADPFDGPEIATLAVAVVGLVSTVWVAWIAHGAKQNARSAKEQVQNDHEVNLRDDVDGIKALVGSIATTVVGIDRGQLYLIDEVRLLKAGYSENRNDIDGLMDTADKRRQRDAWAPPPPPNSRRARRITDV